MRGKNEVENGTGKGGNYSLLKRGGKSLKSFQGREKKSQMFADAKI